MIKEHPIITARAHMKLCILASGKTPNAIYKWFQYRNMKLKEPESVLKFIKASTLADAIEATMAKG